MCITGQTEIKSGRRQAAYDDAPALAFLEPVVTFDLLDIAYIPIIIVAQIKLAAAGITTRPEITGKIYSTC